MKHSLRCQNCTKLLKKELEDRRYCLKCLPEGEDASQMLVIVENGTKLKCECCLKTYEHKRGYTTRKMCGRCRSNERNRSMKIKALDYLGGKCSRCGYNSSPSALQFHHLNPKDKSFTIGRHLSRNWESLKPEVDKCIILCANCHCEIHDELRM